jgi:hypothetical protein
MITSDNTPLFIGPKPRCAKKHRPGQAAQEWVHAAGQSMRPCRPAHHEAAAAPFFRTLTYERRK